MTQLNMDNEHLLYTYRNLKGLLKCVEMELELRGIISCKRCGLKHNSGVCTFTAYVSA